MLRFRAMEPTTTDQITTTIERTELPMLEADSELEAIQWLDGLELDLRAAYLRFAVDQRELFTRRLAELREKGHADPESGLAELMLESYAAVRRAMRPAPLDLGDFQALVQLDHKTGFWLGGIPLGEGAGAVQVVKPSLTRAAATSALRDLFAPVIVGVEPLGGGARAYRVYLAQPHSPKLEFNLEPGPMTPLVVTWAAIGVRFAESTDPMQVELAKAARSMIADLGGTRDLEF